MKIFWRIIVGLMKELSDQNPYQRYLSAHDRTHSSKEWRRFSDDRLRRKYSRAKCC